MSFTAVPITRTYLNGTTPKSGTVTLQLTSPLTNGDNSVVNRPMEYALDAGGVLTASAWATDDTGTLPTGVGLKVTETLTGDPVVTYWIEVPAAGGTIDLATAPRLASAPLPAVVYQPLNQRGMPGGYPELDVNGKVPATMLPSASGGSIAVGTTAGTVAAGDDSRISGASQKSANLADLVDKALSRTNLGLGASATMDLGTLNGTVAAGNDSRIVNALQKGSNLADLTDPAQARGALGLSIGTTNGTVAAGDDSRISGASQKSANLADLTDTTQARSALGLGGAATLSVGTAAGTVAAGNDSRLSDTRAPSGAASGDLSGAYPSPTVAKLSGVAVSGTPAAGKLLTATSSTAATWQTPAAGSGSVSTVIQVPAPTGIAATDQANINTAIAALPTTGGIVQLQAGTYVVPAPASASSGCINMGVNGSTLAGMGIGVTTIQLAPGTTGVTGIVRTPSAVANSKITFRDFTVDGNAANQTGVPLVVGFYCGVTPNSTLTDTDITCDRVEVMNCSGYGFDPHERTTRLLLTGCISHHNGSDGAHDGFTLDACYDSTVIGCVSYSNGRHGFNLVTASSNVTLSGCNSYSNGGSGYVLQNGAKNNSLVGCKAHNNALEGILINGLPQTGQQDNAPGVNNSIKSCTVTASGTHGIHLVGASYNHISDNTVRDSSQTTAGSSNQIYLDESGTTYSTYNTIENNDLGVTSGVAAAPKYGIFEKTANEDYNFVLGNRPLGATTAQISLQGATSASLAAHNGVNEHPAAIPGIHVPPGWGTFWRAARNQAKAGTGRAVVAAVGSSTFAGLYSSNPYSKGVIGCLRTSLQTQYGDGGTGYYSSLWNSPTLTSGGEAAGAISTWNTNGVLIGMTGTGWSEGGNLYGPGCEYMATSVPGDSITFTVRGTQVIIYTLGKDGGRATWTYSIDGAAAVTVTDSASTGLTAIANPVTGLTNATHTVTITHAGTSGAFLSVNGVAGEKSTGVIVNNFARSGATTSSFTQPGRITWNGGPDYPADLLLYCVGANDAVAGLSGDSWAANVRQFLATVKDGTSVTGVNALGNTDVVIVMQHIGKYDNTNWRYQDYVASARGLCDEYGAALVNLHAIGRGSWNYWNSLSYWGNSTSPATSGTDSIHLCDAGHQASANAILPLLTS